MKIIFIQLATFYLAEKVMSLFLKWEENIWIMLYGVMTLFIAVELNNYFKQGE